ncbi:hypothetical protein D3C83_266120 [compost metagenome]
MERFGSSRVMVGSDYPFAIREIPPGKAVAEVAGFTKDQREDLSYRSCLDFLGVSPA